jgi:hypothetical protein
MGRLVNTLKWWYRSAAVAKVSLIFREEIGDRRRCPTVVNRELSIRDVELASEDP